MKRIVLAASALTLIAAPAFAADSTVALNSTVAQACGLGNHISGGVANAATPSLSVTLADGNGQFSGQTLQGYFGNVWCNSPANVTLSAMPLATTNSTTDTSSFTNRFDLEVTVNGVYLTGTNALATYNTVSKPAGSLSTLATGTTPGAFETGTGQYSAVSIKVLPAVRPTGGNYRPVAGAYTGSVVLTVAPAGV